MKRNLSLLLFFCLFPVFAALELKWDLTKRDPRLSFADKEQKFYFSRREGRPVLMMSWSPEQATHLAFYFPRRNARISLPQFGRAVFSLNVWIPEDSDALAVNLRLEDRRKERFHFPGKIPRGSRGWITLTYEVDSSISQKVSWGEKKDSRLDFPMAVYGFSVDYRTDAKRRGEIGFGAFQMQITAGKLDVELETGLPIPVVQPGREDLLGIRIRNPNPEGREFSLRYTLQDVEKISPQKTEFYREKIAAGKSIFLPLPRPVQFGVYDLELCIAEAGYPDETRRMRYCYMIPAGGTPGPESGFLFGCHIHATWYGHEVRERLAFAAATCGVKIFRDDFAWARLEPRRGEWDFADLDRLLNVFEARHIEIQPIFGFHPWWNAKSAGWQYSNPNYRHRKYPDSRGGYRPDYGLWREYVRHAANFFKGRFRFAEIWNEPDLCIFANFSLVEYLKLLEIATEEIHKVNPDVRIMNGGIATLEVPASDSPEPDYLKKLLLQGRGKYDIFAFHGHGIFSYYRNAVSRLLKLRRENGDVVPWYANETAVSSLEVGLVGQAETLFKKLLFSWSRGAVGYNWYNLRDKGTDLKNNENNFGLLTWDFYPKPAFVTYNMLSSFYRGGSFCCDLSQVDDVPVLAFRSRNGDWLLPGWSDGEDEEIVHPLFLTGITGKISRIDLWGNESPLPVKEQAFLWEVGARPVTIRISGQEQLPVISGEILTAKTPLLLKAGDQAIARWRIKNPTDRPQLMRIFFTPPTGIRVDEANQMVKLPAGAAGEVAVTLRASENFGRTLTDRSSMNVEVQLISRKESFCIRQKIHPVIQLPGEMPEKPNFQLDRRSQMVSLLLQEPGNDRLFWKGPNDLSAQIRIWHSEHKLYFAITVKDDIHSQPYHGGEVWRGDNIQMGIHFPGQLGIWVLGFSHLNDGRSECFCWSSPAGEDKKKLLEQTQLKTVRNEAERKTRYHIVIPLAALRSQSERKEYIFQFNLLLNENDGNKRSCYFRLTPGLGDSRDPEKFLSLTIE